MPKTAIAALLVSSLLIVDFLAFHDMFEPHTVRDYLTLAASLIAFAYVGIDFLGGRLARRTR